MSNKRYDSDLTDEEWAIMEPFITAAKPGGRPRRMNIREVVNAIFYLVKTGCKWRMRPKEFPNWKTVHDDFRKTKNAGVWQQMNAAVREQVRVKAGRHKSPSAGSIDSQSVKTTGKGGAGFRRRQASQRPQTTLDCGYAGLGVESLRHRS